MLSVRENLIEGLRENTGLQVYFMMPPVDVAVSMPLLILEEVDNSDHFYRYYEETDTEIEVANVTYEISIYAKNPQDLFIFMPIIDTYMKRIGFKKTWTSGDSYVAPLYCKTLRFTGKIQQLQDGTYRICK
jgi:hypothetical protein